MGEHRQTDGEQDAEPLEEPLPSDREVYRRALTVLALGVVLLASLVGLRGRSGIRGTAQAKAPEPQVEAPKPSAPALSVAAAAPRLDQRIERCGPVTPTARNHFAAPRELSLGRAWVPSQAGHDKQYGFDVVVHFHAHRAALKVVQPFSKRLVFVGLDQGTHTGDYSKPLSEQNAFADLRGSLKLALQKHTGRAGAHVRSLTLSGWSAGVGAIPTLLKRFSADIDAVVILDGLHAGWKLDKPTDGTPKSVEGSYLTPVVSFAKQAIGGEKRLVLTHSQVPTEGYAPTSVTADRLLLELGLARRATEPGLDSFGRTSHVAEGGFTLWAHQGSAERGHCAHVALLADALGEVVLPWLDQTHGAVGQAIPADPAKAAAEPPAADAAGDALP